MRLYPLTSIASPEQEERIGEPIPMIAEVRVDSRADNSSGIALQVLRGMSSNGDVIIIDQQFHVQALSNSQPRCLRVVAFLLRTVRAETEHNLVAVGDRHAIDHCPQMTKTVRREFDTRCEPEFRMTWELGVCFAVVQEAFGGKGALEHREDVLCGDTMPWRSRS
jgi:hypothetical protein